MALQDEAFTRSFKQSLNSDLQKLGKKNDKSPKKTEKAVTPQKGGQPAPKKGVKRKGAAAEKQDQKKKSQQRSVGIAAKKPKLKSNHVNHIAKDMAKLKGILKGKHDTDAKVKQPKSAGPKKEGSKMRKAAEKKKAAVKGPHIHMATDKKITNVTVKQKVSCVGKCDPNVCLCKTSKGLPMQGKVATKDDKEIVATKASAKAKTRMHLFLSQKPLKVGLVTKKDKVAAPGKIGKAGQEKSPKNAPKKGGKKKPALKKGGKNATAKKKKASDGAAQKKAVADTKIAHKAQKKKKIKKEPKQVPPKSPKKKVASKKGGKKKAALNKGGKKKKPFGDATKIANLKTTIKKANTQVPQKKVASKKGKEKAAAAHKKPQLLGETHIPGDVFSKIMKSSNKDAHAKSFFALDHHKRAQTTKTKQLDVAPTVKPHVKPLWDLDF